MPRRDWNTNPAHTQKPRHKKMHSGARGKGHDRKMKARKRAIADTHLDRKADRRRPDAPMQNVVRDGNGLQHGCMYPQAGQRHFAPNGTRSAASHCGHGSGAHDVSTHPG